MLENIKNKCLKTGVRDFASHEMQHDPPFKNTIQEYSSSWLHITHIQGAQSHLSHSQRSRLAWRQAGCWELWSMTVINQGGHDLHSFVFFKKRF
jgi:hypothetical protein